jgi:hypothetical protein
MIPVFRWADRRYGCTIRSRTLPSASMTSKRLF